MTDGPEQQTGRNGQGGVGPGLIRVATYNIHGGIGVDGRFNIDRTAAVINSLQCRIVALQEVRFGTGKDMDILRFLARRSGMRAIAGITVDSAASPFGNAVLTDLPIAVTEKYDLSVSGRERRGALDILVRARGGPLRILATHLGLKPRERRMQVRRLLDILQRTEDRAATTVLLGDINEWFLWGRPLRWIHRYFGRSGTVATYPSRNPLFALDRIWCHPRQRMVSIGAFTSPQARLASDHLPLTAEIEAL